jgi:hypothetical protein
MGVPPVFCFSEWHGPPARRNSNRKECYGRPARLLYSTVNVRDARTTLTTLSVECPVGIFIGSQTRLERVLANIVSKALNLLFASDDMIEIFAHPQSLWPT